MVDLNGQNHALEQALQRYGEHTDSCGVHWKGPAASGEAVGEDSILAALDRVPVDEATGKLDPAASARTKSCLLIATINSGHARALRKLVEMGCSPNGALDGYDTGRGRPRPRQRARTLPGHRRDARRPRDDRAQARQPPRGRRVRNVYRCF